jgi:ketosteroid isomerase-like protein
LVAFSLLAGVCCQDKSAIEKEKAAIKAVIEEEKAAYYEQDLSRLDDSWIQEPSSRKLFLSPNGITELDGWTKIHQNNVEATEIKWNEPMEPARYSNFTINVYGNTALVLLDSNHNIKNQDEASTLKMRRILHMVKIDGEWKIDFMAMYFLPHALMGQEAA